MKLQKPFISKYAICAGLITAGFLWFFISALFDSDSPFEMPTASASSPYGIQGHTAPELNLPDWIDGNGNKTSVITLNDYRGKVVYLYFFQDW